MKPLAILAICLVALTLFLVQADLASAEGGRYGSGGTTMTQRGRGGYSSGTATRGQTYQQQRGTTTQQQRGATTTRRAGPARPARAGELDLMLVAGAFGGLGLLAVGGGQALRRRTAVA